MFSKKLNFSILACLLFLVVSAQAQNDIHKVDFKNFTYEIGVEGEDKIKATVKNGEYMRQTKDRDDDLYFEVSGVEYGDLTGDGRDEAVVRILYNTGGSGNFTSGLVYTLKNGKPVVLAELEVGDRGFGGIVSAKVVGNLLVVERNDAGENGAACCPEFIVTTRYKLNGSELAEVGESTRLELHPAKRIAFEKGTSMAVFSLTVPTGEIQRYVVGARKGQTLLISSNAKPATNISYRLVRGDGSETELPNGLSVKLNENGDYLFELSNNTEKDLTISVKVAIN